MKTTLFILLFALSGTLLAAQSDDKNMDKSSSMTCFQDIDVDIDNDNIVLTCSYDNEQWVEITPDCELYVNGSRISLTRHQEHLLDDYYDCFMEIIDQSREIGIEGAKIGIKGVKVSLVAVRCLLKMALTEYDTDTFEKEIEEESDRINEQAEELNEMAEELEKSAKEFEILHVALKRQINVLNQLVWF